MKKIIRLNLINFLWLMLIELIFELLTFDEILFKSLIGIIIYTFFVSTIITFISCLFKNKLNYMVNFFFLGVICFWYALQFVFYSSMHTFFTLPLIKLGDQAANFLGETFRIIFRNLYGIIILFIPVIGVLIFKKKIYQKIRLNKRIIFTYLIVIPILFGSYMLYLNIDKEEDYSLYNVYYNVNNTNLSIQKLGVLASMKGELCQSLFDFEDKIVVEDTDNNDTFLKKEDYNELDLDLSNKSLNKNIKMYIENNDSTKKNNYTGFFKDKNLIFIVAESYSEIAVSKELTPTLDELTNSGFVFDNFYVPYYLSTIAGEYQALTGLYPNLATLKTWRNGENAFPYGMASKFEENGYNTYAYHMHSGYFQDRNKYLKALGFDNFKACDISEDFICQGWPESDIKMIENSFDDYIDSEKPFLTYYMTISGHMDYNFYNNAMAIKNQKEVDNLPYSTNTRAYLAGQIELDRALELLLSKLKERGKLDDTVIVMVADHYPYALSLKQINELSTYKRDSLFEVNHNSLVIWNSKLDKQEISKVGMSADILPTIYNLFDIPYDSRLFIGKDLFSDSEGLAIFNNYSWISDRGYYDSIRNSYRGTEDSNYVKEVNRVVQNKLIFSRILLETDGYRYINEK